MPEESTSMTQQADAQQRRSLTAFFPTYRLAGAFLRAMEGRPEKLYFEMDRQIQVQRGTPQKQMDWSNPDEWIPVRLQGKAQELARHLWTQSHGVVNPRHTRGCWLLASHHSLLRADAQGLLQVTERGRRFLDEPEGQTVAEIDAYEGVLVILRLVAERGPGRRSDFLPDFTEFCHQYTTYRSEAVIIGTLYDRLVNLLDRGYIERRGVTYESTQSGLAYLERYAHLMAEQTDGIQGPRAALRRLARTLSDQARAQLSEHLLNMDPFQFEHLIKFLLDEMGYTDVEVTSPVNDKGVDVVANIELGVSRVHEVIQVKRQRGNVGRRVLDQLRGSLHRFRAVRGTIITTGGFSKGAKEAAFELGAAPITLIDGETLLDLLVEHEIGVRKRAIEYLEFDVSKLTQFDTATDEAVEGG